MEDKYENEVPITEQELFMQIEEDEREKSLNQNTCENEQKN
jgi:hypothetical protein